jgi:Na+/phosphate symporter
MMATMIGLINSSLMTLKQAVGTMMGDEIGTTIATQIVAYATDNLERTHLALVKRRFGHFAAANHGSGLGHVL